MLYPEKHWLTLPSLGQTQATQRSPQMLTASHIPECSARNAREPGGGPEQYYTSKHAGESSGDYHVFMFTTWYKRRRTCLWLEHLQSHPRHRRTHPLAESQKLGQRPEPPSPRMRAAGATCFSWHFLGNRRESEAGRRGKEKIQRLVFKSFPTLMVEKADGIAKLWSFLTCTLYSSFVPKGRKKILGSSSSFLETSTVMPMVEY